MTTFFKRIVIVFLFGLLVGLNLNNSSNLEFNSDESSTILFNLLRGGGGNSKYSSNFDKNFHQILRKIFPDSKRRIEFEKSQLEFYNSARLKLYRAPTLSMKDKMRLLSPEEQDAINYFTSQGLYRSQQYFRTEPNIFDTRESFLIKMHNESNRNRFLKSLKESD